MGGVYTAANGTGGREEEEEEEGQSDSESEMLDHQKKLKTRDTFSVRKSHTGNVVSLCHFRIAVF